MPMSRKIKPVGNSDTLKYINHFFEKICPKFAQNFQEWRKSAVYLTFDGGSNPPLATLQKAPVSLKSQGFRGFSFIQFISLEYAQFVHDIKIFVQNLSKRFVQNERGLETLDTGSYALRNGMIFSSGCMPDRSAAMRSIVPSLSRAWRYTLFIT